MEKIKEQLLILILLNKFKLLLVYYAYLFINRQDYGFTFTQHNTGIEFIFYSFYVGICRTLFVDLYLFENYNSKLSVRANVYHFILLTRIYLIPSF